MDFDWQTEAEDEWPVADRPDAASSRASKRSPWLAIVAVLIVATALLGWRQLNLRAEAATDEVEADIEASFRLAEQAARAQDRELLVPLLSGRDPDWTEGQKQLLEKSLLFANSPRSLLPGLEVREPVTIAITTTSDLKSAELTVVRTYSAFGVGGTDEALTLRQTHVLRRGTEQWLLSPPSEEFWGDWEALETEHLAVVFPHRDRLVARRLAARIGDRLQQLCEAEAIDCSSGYRLRVRLVSDPRSLIDAGTESRDSPRGTQLVLPAPSLIGHPVDDQAFRILERAYARPIMATAVTELLNYRCCRQRLFFQAALEWYLARDQLQEWPLHIEEYVRATDSLDRASQLRRLWGEQNVENVAPAEKWTVYALLEFLLAARDADGVLASMAMIQRAADVGDWVRVTTNFTSLPETIAAMRSFLFAQVESRQPDFDPPLEDLLLVCQGTDGFDIFRYNPVIENWTVEHAPSQLSEDYYMLISLPDNRGVIMGGSPFGVRGADPIVYQDGEVFSLSHPQDGRFYTPALPLAASRILDPQGKFLPVWISQVNDFTGELALLDLPSCRDGSCRWRLISQVPQWAPDGSELLLRANDGTIFRGQRDAARLVEIGNGTAPFWLDGSTPGFVDMAGHPVMVSSPGETQSLLDPTALFGRALPHEQQINDVLVHPSGYGPLVVFADGGNRSSNAVFVVQRAQDDVPFTVRPPAASEINLVLETLDPVFGPPLSSLSPDGRWLLLYTGGGNRQNGRFLIFDLERGRLVLRALKPAFAAPGFFPAQNHDWTADGEWLARIAGDYIDLISPGDATLRRFLVPPGPPSRAGECSSLAWIRR